MLENLRSRWVGVTLSLIGAVAIIALAMTGKLELYIHPRYTVFTIIMAVIGGLAAAAGFLFAPPAHDHDDDDEDDHEVPRGRWRAVSILGSAVIILAAAIGLLAVPPVTLSSATAQNRDVSTGSSALDSADTTALVGADSTSFTVKDWATLLRQGLGEDYFTGKKASISGFVVPGNTPNEFYLARFLITCCAVDAQPLGVPVYLTGWQSQVSADQWLQIDGRFGANPDATSNESIVLTPDTVTPIQEPSQPYVY